MALDLVAAVAVRSPLNHPRLGLGPVGCARRAGTASKGALFVARLRDVMGERAFWAALGKYTRRFAGRAATTRDFQAVFAAETHADLSKLFEEWAYGRGPSAGNGHE